MRYKKKQESIRAYTRMVKTVCGECLVGCGLKFFMHDDQVIDMAGDEDHPINKGSVCPRGARIMECLLNNGSTLAWYPVMKTGFKDTGKRISWNEGINYVAGRLREIEKEFGKDALSVLITNPSITSNHYYGLRFAKSFGTSKIAVYDPMKPASALAKCVLGGYKGALSNPPHDWLNSKVILVLGSEIASEVILMGYLLDAKEKGAKIICVDTKYSPIMIKADYPVIINPGTFDTFMLGIISTIIGEELYDPKTLKRWAKGHSDIVKACLSYNQTDIAAKCGIQLETIPNLGRILAENHPIQVIGSVREDQVQGADGLARLAWMSIVLLALNNSLGMKGGGWNWLGTGSPPFAIEQEDNISSTSIELQPDCEYLLKEIVEKETCKALIWDGCIPELIGKELTNALAKLKLVVHLSDKNDTAKEHAHISFPVTNWLEEEGLAFSHYRSVQWRDRVCNPVGERRSAGLFWKELAERMGYEIWSPRESKGNIFSPVEMFDGIKQTNALSGLSQLNTEDLKGGGILWPCLVKEKAVFEDDKALIKGRWLLYRNDEEYPGTNQVFPTTSGKIELINETCKTMGWGLPPFNSINPESKIADPYLYRLVLCSAPGFLGNLGYTIEDKYVIGINPADTQRLNVTDGDRIVLEKEDKGTFEAPAWVTKKIARNTVGLIDVEEPSYYARFRYHGGWVEGTRVRIFKLSASEA